jgi:hypothetical protein
MYAITLSFRYGVPMFNRCCSLPVPESSRARFRRSGLRAQESTATQSAGAAMSAGSFVLVALILRVLGFDGESDGWRSIRQGRIIRMGCSE